MSLEAKTTEVQKDIESLTMHGIARVATTKNKYSRIIWLLLCISAATALGIVAVNSFMKYYQYHIYTHNSVIQHSKLALPAITFCHTNFYDPFAYYSKSPPVFQKWPKDCSFIDAKYFANKMNQWIFWLACRMFIGTLNAKTSGMNAETPIYFRFPTGFEIAPNTQPCITLNRNATLVQQIAGKKYGLHMIIYDQGDAKSMPYSPNEPLTDNPDGIYATIHDPEQIVPMGDGIVIPSGYHTHISVRKNVIKRLQYPYPSNCTNDSSNRESIFPGKNTQLLCYSSCAYIQIYNMCPGVMPEMKVFMKAPRFPLPGDIYNNSFWKCIANSITRLDYQQCDCPRHCNDATYTTVVNRNPWPQYWQASSFVKLVNDIEGKANRTLPAEEISKRLLKVSIYYEDFKEHVSEERPLYDLSTIASDLGGQMGLFMGASLLSLAEIMALVLTHFRRCLCRSNTSTNPSP